jgi:uncharacterized protein YqhQ
MKKSKTANTDEQPGQRKTTIGGQALIEGLLMIGPEKKAMAVRKPDGQIVVEPMSMTQFSGVANWPFVRGSIRLFRQLVSGTKALLRSAELAEESEEHESENEDRRQDEAEDQSRSKGRIGPAISRFFDRHANLVLYGTAVLGILFSVILFILLPNVITHFLRDWTGLGTSTQRGTIILLNLVEGLIRIVLFVGYLFFANRMNDIRRVWMYHGAEHKTIACYEARKPLTVENARVFSRLHPRCGTAFLFIVILLSIIIFSLVGWWGRWINLLIRFALVPVVAGIAYEVIRLAGRYDNKLTRLISKPGLWLQHFTTAEPDDDMLEVAIVALEAVRPARADSDRW